jgi:hypothetical protein
MHQKEKIINPIETDFYILGLREDGIFHVYYKAYTELDVKLQLEILDVFIKVCGSKKHPFIFEAAEYVTITKEARDNATSLEDLSPLSMSAVIVQNIAYKLISDFYLKINKPKAPYKVFKNFEDGIDWLLKENNVS